MSKWVTVWGLVLSLSAKLEMLTAETRKKLLWRMVQAVLRIINY